MEGPVRTAKFDKLSLMRASFSLVIYPPTVSNPICLLAFGCFSELCESWQQSYLWFLLQSDVYPLVVRQSSFLHSMMPEVIIISKNLQDHKEKALLSSPAGNTHNTVYSAVAKFAISVRLDSTVHQLTCCIIWEARISLLLQLGHGYKYFSWFGSLGHSTKQTCFSELQCLYVTTSYISIHTVRICPLMRLHAGRHARRHTPKNILTLDGHHQKWLASCCVTRVS